MKKLSSKHERQIKSYLESNPQSLGSHKAHAKSKALHKAKGEHSVDYSVRKGTSKGLSYNEAGKASAKRLSQGKKY